jgi:hypothetical protein
MTIERSAPRFRSEVDELRASGLFDPDWYLAQYPDVAILGMDPVEHYVWLGARLDRNPSPNFDTAAYLAKNPDVPATGSSPLLHFVRSRRGDGAGQGAAPGSAGGVSESGADDPAPAASGRPHYGKALHDLVSAAQARGKPEGRSRDYDTIRAEFDTAFYLTRYPDIARAPHVDPVQHYIDHGAKEGRDPSPDFSTRQYLARYPEVGKSGLNPFHHWLAVGRRNGYIAEGYRDFEAMSEIIGRPPDEVQRLLQAQRRDLRQRLEHGTLGEMVAKAAELEPLIAHAWGEALQVKMPPFHSDEVVAQVVAMHRLHQAAEFRRARFVVVLNRPRWGGGRRMEGHILHALAERHPPAQMLVVTTEEGGAPPPGRFPDGCRHVDLATPTGSLAPAARQRVLVEFLRSLRPQAVFNVNSKLLWEALTPYGKALSASTSVHACLFCNEQTVLGHWTGYPARFFYRHFDVLAGVFCDSHALARSLREQFRIPPEQAGRIAVLEAPVDPGQPVAPAPRPLAGRRPQIFWSGRLDRQKRIDIVYALARRMPEADFRVWGEEVLESPVARL